MEVRDDGGVSGCRCRSVGGRPKEKVSSVLRKVCCYGRKVMVRRGASSQASHGSQKKRNERRGAEDRGHGAAWSVQRVQRECRGADARFVCARTVGVAKSTVLGADCGLRIADCGQQSVWEYAKHSR